jgi:hypothetical protein
MGWGGIGRGRRWRCSSHSDRSRRCRDGNSRGGRHEGKTGDGPAKAAEASAQGRKQQKLLLRDESSRSFCSGTKAAADRGTAAAAAEAVEATALRAACALHPPLYDTEVTAIV